MRRVLARHWAIEGFARAPIVQRDLAGAWQPRKLEHVLDLGLGCAIEHRRSERHAFHEILGEMRQLLVVQSIDCFGLAGAVIDPRQQFAHLGDVVLCLEQAANALPQSLRCPSQMNLEDLPDIHPRWHTERIQHDVHWRAVGHVRHVLDRNDLGDHTLVAVTTGHLVTGLQAALDRDVDLDHFLHAGGQFVALRQLLLFLLEHLVELHARLRDRVLHRFELTRGFLRGKTNVEPVVAIDAVEILLGDARAFG